MRTVLKSVRWPLKNYRSIEHNNFQNLIYEAFVRTLLSEKYLIL